MSTTAEKPQNPHYTEFLSAHSRTREEFAAEAAESPDSACTLLSRWAESQIEDFGPESAAAEWAARQIAKLKRVTGEEKALAVSAPPVEPIAEPVKSKAEKVIFESIPVEVMDESEEIPRQKEEIPGRIRGVVGQEKALAYLERELRNIEKGQPLPFFGLYDDTGLGKTHLINRFMAALPRHVKTFSLNCKDKLNLTDSQGKAYFEAISEALAEGTPTIIHLDEFGNKNGNGSLQQYIMSHISKAPDGKALAIHGGDPLPFNPSLLGFIVSSFDPSKAAVDIVDRIKQPAELVLTAYSAPELTDILRAAINRACLTAHVPIPRMSEASLAMVARSMRGNARQANDIAEEIRKERADSDSFTLSIDSAKGVMRTVGVYPHGLNQAEIKILQALSTGAKNRDTLMQKTGVEKAHWTRAVNYLSEGTGRGNPFQLCKADGTPVADACGSLIDYERGKYHLTLHGGKVVAILKKDKWID